MTTTHTDGVAWNTTFVLGTAGTAQYINEIVNGYDPTNAKTEIPVYHDESFLTPPQNAEIKGSGVWILVGLGVGYGLNKLRNIYKNPEV